MTQIDHLHTLLRRDMDKVDIMIFTTTNCQPPPKTRQLESFPAELSEGNWRSIIDLMAALSCITLLHKPLKIL